MTVFRSAIWFLAAVACGGSSAALVAYLILLASEPSMALQSMKALDLPTALGSISGGAVAILRVLHNR